MSLERSLLTVGKNLAGSLLAAAWLLPGIAAAAEPLVGPDWLAAHQSEVVVLDVRDQADGDSAALFAAGHVPGAVHSDYAKAGWRKTIDGVPGMLPPPAEIEALVGGLGIRPQDHVVIVSNGTSSTDFGSAARVFWTLEVMGHQELSILEGGQAGWVAKGLPVETGAGRTPVPVAYHANFKPELVATAKDVEAARAAGVPLIDARPQAQYTGEVVPPNVQVAGTIPGAYSMPHDRLVLDGGKRVVDEQSLEQLLASLKLADGGEKIAFCNTGHWASVGWFVLNKVGHDPDVRMYDGSMAEWAKAKGLPTEVGARRTLP